ncbi:MAG: right-handed parallel beta-helix repeat-containing protein, partial [Gammaproteobacteria bacterium]|nr:right-handed parallel beta-helix repeat-containing protein [Gammaproteobacteria bacterium]
KATLAWTDVEGSPSATFALVNDLDLTLISPTTATTYYPWDLTLPAGDTIAAVAGPGPDRVNNVEQVVVNMPNGAALETGQWTARVTAYDLAEPQWFSLVLTPPCPIIVTGNVTLTGDVVCTAHELVPAAVEIVGANAVFDCAGYEISGGNDAIGVQISANGVTVTNCEISNFRTGIEVTNAASNTVLLNNRMSLVDRGMVMTGNGHRMVGNTVSDVRGSSSRGIVISGDNADMTDNILAAGSAASLPGSVGIEVLPGSDNSLIEDNGFSGFWQTGVLLRSSLDQLPIQSSRLINNEFEGIGESAVVVSGNAPLTVVDDNEISIFGQASPAILVEDFDSLPPENTQLTNNTIRGGAASGQMGIQLKNAIEAVVRANQISDVQTGISEESCKESQMSANVIGGVAPFFVTVGIESNNSEGSFFHITGNNTSRTLTGIAVSGPGPQYVSGNTVAAYTTGISVNAGAIATSSSISSNAVATDAQPAPGIGISVSASPELLVQNNTISNSRSNPVDVTAIYVTDSDGARIIGNTCNLQGDAIIVNNSDDVELADNIVDAQGMAIAVQGNATEILDNTLTAAVGIRASGDQGLMERNTVDATTGVGIHLTAGLDAILRDNEVTPTAGTGVRLGNIPLPCAAGTPITVDNALLENNVINGTPALDILCDVGTYTVVP